MATRMTKRTMTMVMTERIDWACFFIGGRTSVEVVECDEDGDDDDNEDIVHFRWLAGWGMSTKKYRESNKKNKKTKKTKKARRSRENIILVQFKNKNI